jgi:hypothetical protein
MYVIDDGAGAGRENRLILDQATRHFILYIVLGEETSSFRREQSSLVVVVPGERDDRSRNASCFSNPCVFTNNYDV